VGIAPAAALRYTDPQQIADLIMRAEAQERHSSVRSLREDPGTAAVPLAATGQLLKALG
jgi:hypothetical protein